MLIQLLIFIGALAGLLISAKFFTSSAEKIGAYLKLPAFVIGVFIVGIGTSLPELVSAILSVRQGVSEILPGNVMGANISNILLITGFVAYLNGRDIQLTQSYIFIDLHYLIGAFLIFSITCLDGSINKYEALVGIIAFMVYSIYLLKSGATFNDESGSDVVRVFPYKEAGILALAGVGIYFGADYTVTSLSNIATVLSIPPSIIALTLLSLGTTLPELAVNISAIKQGKAEMAVGNVLGSCIFNSLMVPGIAAWFGDVKVPSNLLHFSLPVMCVSGVFFYLLTQDKRISKWEGVLFILVYVLFIVKVADLA